MKIPDFISPVVGYRVWRWDATGLKSLNGEPWLPGLPLAAGCRTVTRGPMVVDGEAVNDAHEAPNLECTCGIYAAKNIEHLRTTRYSQYGIHGEVNLWGTVVEHKFGWRAQYAYPKSLFLPPDILPFTLARIQSRLKTLTAYRIDVFVADPKGNIPLWAQGSDFDPAGLDYVINMSNEYYVRRRQERTLKKGDRVALLAGGIAVVEHTDDKGALVVLWNRIKLRIARKGIVWDEFNMRWECGALLEEQCV
jgi:hypothetical protein